MTNITWFKKRLDLNREIWNHIRVTDIVLDIGCGIRPQSFFIPSRHYCCEPCTEYVQFLKHRLNNERYCIVNITAQEAIRHFAPNSFDSVFLLDIIEHLTRGDGMMVIQNALKIARQQVIIYVPLGYRQQDIRVGEKDAWGLHGGPWQNHRSAWLPEDFSFEGWEILACNNYSYVDLGKIYDRPQGIFWAIWNNPQAVVAVQKYAAPGSLARLQTTDRIIGVFACLLRRLPKPLSISLLNAGIWILVHTDLLNRYVKLKR